MTAALILAAGLSRRMGRPKAFLPHRDPAVTFLDYLLASARLGGADSVYVIGRIEDTALARATAVAGATYVANAAPERGQLSSLLTGIDGIRDIGVGSIFVLPVDIPLISPEVVTKVVTAARSSSAVIVRAAHAGRHGHPVLFKRPVFDEIRTADPTVGARAVVRADAGRVLEVEVDDAGVLEDVDTPEDYERLFGRRLDDHRA